MSSVILRLARLARQVLAFVVLLPALAVAEPDYLVDADWLAERIDDENLVVLEVRYHPHRYFTVGHIPGAVQVQRFNDLGDNEADPLMSRPRCAAGASATTPPWCCTTTRARHWPRACTFCLRCTVSRWSR